MFGCAGNGSSMKEEMVVEVQEVILETEKTDTDMEKVRALYAIETLEKATKIEILVAGEDGTPFCGELREMAVALCRHSGLDEALLKKYDAEIQAAKTSTQVPNAEISGENVVSLLEAAIDLCEGQDSAEEILRYFKLVRDVMYLWGTIGE